MYSVYMLSCYGTYVCRCMYTCVHIGDIRVSSSVTSMQGISLNLGLSVSATLATQHDLGIFISASLSPSPTRSTWLLEGVPVIFSLQFDIT